MANPPIDLASLAAAVTAQTTAIQNFTDQQILLYTTTDPTVVMTDANGNPVTIPSWYATVGANAAAVNAMQAQVTANTNAIAAIQTADTTFGTEIAAIQAAQSTNETHITTLQTQMAAVQSQQSADVTNISNLQTAVSALQTGSTSSGSSLTTLQNQVNAIQTQQNTDIASISTLNTNVTSLTTTVNANQAAITTLQSTLATVQTNQSTDQTNITTIQGQISTLQTQQNTNATNISANAGNIATLQTQVGALTTRVGDDETNLSNTNANVLNLQNTVTSQGSTITGLQSSLTAAQTQESTDVANLQGQINTQVTDLGNLQTTVNNLPLPGMYSPPYVSARFFTQTFLDDQGHLVGGISRQTGKLWLLNGGWISERLDEIEGRTTVPTYTFFGTDSSGSKPLLLGAPTTPRYVKLIGDLGPDPNGGANGSQLVGYQLGITPTGNIEIGGQDFAEIINYITARLVPDSKIVPSITDLQYGYIGDTTLLQVGAGVLASPTVGSDMSCAQLAARVGVYPVLLSFTGRTITGGTANTVTTWNAAVAGAPGTIQTLYPLTANSPSQTLSGTVAGVPGTLTATSSDSALTFTPAFATGSKFVGDDQPFIPSDAANVLAAPLVIIGMGRTDVTAGKTVAEILSYITAIVAAISKMNAKFIIVTPYNYATEDNTTTNGKAIISLEQQLQSLYPTNTYNSRQFLQNAYAGQAGANATTYFGNGLVPAAYFNADNETLTTTAAQYLLNGLYAFAAERNFGNLPTFA